MSDQPPVFPLLDLQQVESSAGAVTHYRLAVTPQLSTPFAFLYGGSGIAACAEASEQATGRPLQWITTQFLGSPAPGDVVDIEVVVAVEGRMTTQTQVSGRVGGELMFTSLCAHNIRPVGRVEPIASMPDVPPPEDCDEFAEPFADSDGSFFRQMSRRVAAGTIEVDGSDRVPSADGEAFALWCRLHASETGSAATQGFVGDVGPLGVSARLGMPLGGTSLDNTIRIVDARPSEWVLLELDVDGFSRSVGHSTVRIWAQDGRLLGLGQQSALIRRSHHGR